MRINKKQIIMFLFLIVLINVVSAQEILSFYDGKVTFQRPPNVFLWEESPDVAGRGRIRLQVNICDAEKFRTSKPTSITEHVANLFRTRENLTRSDLLNLFNESTDIVITSFLPRVGIRNSYRRLIYESTYIGETIFEARARSLNASNSYSYDINLIVDNVIVTINLSFSTDEDIFSGYGAERFFVTRNNVRYWKDDMSIISFYNVLNSEDYITLPRQLQQLREAYEIIIQTLRIRQDNIYMSNIRLSAPLQFQRTHTTTRRLQIREGNATRTPRMSVLPEGSDVQVLEIHSFTETIDGITAPWALVTTKEGITGWFFYGFLQLCE